MTNEEHIGIDEAIVKAATMSFKATMAVVGVLMDSILDELRAAPEQREAFFEKVNTKSAEELKKLTAEAKQKTE